MFQICKKIRPKGNEGVRFGIHDPIYGQNGIFANFGIFKLLVEFEDTCACHRKIFCQIIIGGKIHIL